jgi:hypothetical protein
MTVQDMVESVIDFLVNGDTGHFYIIKTPNHLQILSALDTSPFPVSLYEPNEFP